MGNNVEGINSKRSSSHATSADHSQYSTTWNKGNKGPNIFRLPRSNSWDNLNRPQEHSVYGKGTLRGWNLILSQLHGLVVKKILYSFRCYSVIFLQTIVPLCIMWVGITLLRKDTYGFRKLSMTSRALMGASVVSAVVGPVESAASRLEKLYREAVLLSGGKPLSLSPVQLAGILNQFMVKKTLSRDQDILIGAKFTADDINNLSTSFNVTALYNVQADRSEDMSVALVMKVIHRYCLNLQDTNVTDERHVNFAVQPLPLTGEEAERHVYMISRHFCIHSSVTILLSMTFLTSAFAIFLVKERKRGSRHIQLLSGADPLTFYIGTLLADMLIYMSACVVIFSSLLLFSRMSLMYQNCGIILIYVMISYGLTSLPVIYSLQFLFNRPTLCMLVLFSARITIGSFILLFSSEDSLLFGSDSLWPSRKHITVSFNMFSPSYSLFVSLYTMCMDFEYKENCFMQKITCDNNSIYQCRLGSQAVRMVFELIVPLICWSSLFILIDCNVLLLFRWFLSVLKKQPLDNIAKLDDIDVQMEYRRISRKSFKDCIVLKNIVKRYGKKIVINNITMAVSHGECFCFLGREKSGKSTLLNLMTRLIYPTSGNILIDNKETTLWTVKAHIGMSYCPQKIALLEELTGRDTLLLHGRLRGVSNTLLKVVSQNLINELRILNPDSACAEYSPTDTKKLSIAVSLIGASRTIVLDEPTFGLDYVDKKTVWRLLSCIQRDHCTLIVATSSAEECGILCGEKSKMTILNEGKLACLTSPSVLMNNYGSGYTVIVQFRTDDSGNVYSQMPFLNSAVEVFTNVEIISDKDVCRLHFSNSNLNLGKLFAVLEDGIRYYNIADYSVQKTSLAHILYSLSVISEEEYIEIPLGASSSFDIWPPRTSAQQPFETYVN